MNDTAYKCEALFCGNATERPNSYCSPACRESAEGVPPYEAVNHPKHYNDHPSGVECIDVIEHMPFNIGTAMKYLWRAGLKPGQDFDQDLKKAIWYIERQRTIDERVKR